MSDNLRGFPRVVNDLRLPAKYGAKEVYHTVN